ncbi:hypothetical protein [Persephonella sp. IF05-L8]|uniref:hypothetical protein n=1 Tax=Persephonella sp. IF05-L8 TaxID=1158338 RepID=UPI00049836A0
MEENKNNDLKEKKLELLKEAIKDTQTTISVLDLKARFLLAVNLAIIGGTLLFVRSILNVVFKENTNSQIDILFIFIFLFAGFIIVWNIWIIYKLIQDVINPRNNPFQQILRVDAKYEQSPFFPVPEKGYFDFAQFKKQIDDYDEDDIKNIYIVELLKVSYIRHQKLTNLNNIIYKYFKWLLITLGTYLFIVIVLIACTR